MNPELLDDVIRRALAEDAPWGDLTSEVFLPAETPATAVLVSREPGVLSGLDVFARTFELVDSSSVVEKIASNGARIEPGAVLARISGTARSVLRAERIALNLSQRMTGIATLTAQYVALTEGTKARVVDTRKTTPGLRMPGSRATRLAVARAPAGRNASEVMSPHGASSASARMITSS